MQWRNLHAGLHRRRESTSHTIVTLPLQPADIDLTDVDVPSLLVKRAPDSSSDSSSSGCVSGSNDPHCQLPTGSGENNTLIIVLGVLLPVFAALVSFVILHRRYKARVRLEDADKHASLDFGLGEGRRKGRKNKNPDMAQNFNGTIDPRPGKGMSMDMLNMDMGSPYFLPNSRNSMNSMSRSAHDGDDPYSPVTMMRREASPNSNYGARKTSTSARTESSADAYTTHSNGKDHLLQHAQLPSKSAPPADQPSPAYSEPLAMPEPAFARKAVGSNPSPLHAELPALEEPAPELPATAFVPPPRGESTNHQTIPVIELPDSADAPPPVPEKDTQPDEHREQDQDYGDWATYADVLGIVQKDFDDPSQLRPADGSTPGAATIQEPYDHYEMQDYFDEHRFSETIRPLPDYDPNDTAEQRANRIRSFYKEYFDDSKGGGDYYEDYGEEYHGEGTVFDPETGEYYTAGPAPYAQPMGRRAMTPPPRGPPRFRGDPRARAYSSASGRPPAGGRPRGRPARKLPPPKPLQNLPTPHLLQTDPGLMSAIDWAPPTSYKDRQLGRAESPLLASRPYSPSVRAHTPLASAFTDLPSMPSPHHLRKSGTYTALDFAPAPRFARDGASDSGSIRSGRSHLSPYQAANIRAGAYRVSRLVPKDTVGTRDDLAITLKPQWGMRP